MAVMSSNDTIVKKKKNGKERQTKTEDQNERERGRQRDRNGRECSDLCRECSDLCIPSPMQSDLCMPSLPFWRNAEREGIQTEDSSALGP